MAGQSRKKQQKHSESAEKLYGLAIISVTVPYLAYRIFWQFASVTKWRLCALVIHLVLHYVTFNGITEASNLGLEYAYYQDALFVNCAVQCFSMWTYRAWYLFLLIPSYLGYKVGRPLLSFLSQSGKQASDPVTDASEEKRLAKKERQQNKMKFKTYKN